MDIKAILTEHGVDAEAIAKLSKAIEAAVGNEFVEKQRYKDKLSDIETLKTSLKTAEDNAATAEAYKQKYDAEVTAHTQTKTDYAEKEVADTKRTALRTALKTEGANEKLIKLLEKEFDLAKIKVDGDKIKDWSELVKPVKEQFSEVFGANTSPQKLLDLPPTGSTPTEKETILAMAQKAMGVKTQDK